jgi:hypothetical protein
LRMRMGWRIRGMLEVGGSLRGEEVEMQMEMRWE